ncbi:hypothetical protein Tco_0315539 [Tanacetum coccineum]
MGCGQPCVGFYCYLCTCQQCGFSLNDGTCMNCTYGDGKPVTCCECESPLNGGFCLICASRAGNSSACDPNSNSYNDSLNFYNYTPNIPSTRLLVRVIEEQSKYINCLSWNHPTFYDNDDEEYSIQFKEYLENSSKAITPDLPTEEPEYSLSIEDEHLSTISETESDEVIKSSVENLVPIPREFEGVSDDTCDVPSCDNSPPLELDIKCQAILMFPTDESGLFTPLSDLNEDECVDPGDDIDEIDAFYHDSEGDIHYLESLLSDNITLSLPPKVFLDHDPRSLSNDLKIMVKVFDPGIHEKIFSPTYESLTFEDRHYLSFTYVIRTFLPYFTYPVVSPFPLSSGSEDIIFDPGISAFHFSLEPVAFKCPMEVCSSTCFIPNFTMIWGEIARILKALVLGVLSIVHSLFKSLACLYWESDILNLID